MQNLPFVCLSVNKCEADDIIAVLCKKLSVDNEVIIVSSDSDYKQLLKYSNVKMYDPYPTKMKFVKLDFDIDEWIIVSALHGQAKDNIYNVFTRLDFPLEYNALRADKKIPCIRKPSLTEKKALSIYRAGNLDKWLNELGPEEARIKNKSILLENSKNISDIKKPLYEENVAERFKINKKIINFDEIPVVLEKEICRKFDEFELAKIDDFYPFFKKYGWNSVLDEYTQTENTLYRLF